MKHRIWIFCLLAATVISSTAQNQSREQKGEYTIKEKGFNHRVWERTRVEKTPHGEERIIKSDYTELESGMYYQENGEWKESEAVIELVAGGAVAQKGQHKVQFQANINSEKAVELTMRDGKKLSSRILGLSFYDTATGQSVLISELKDSVGFLQPPNQVLYPDAFTDFKADIRYTYTKGGFEQDIIFREQIPSPQEWGLDPATTRLQLLTEFDNPPQPKSEKQVKGAREMDKVLDFGEMRIGVGKAFMVGEDKKSATRVDKVWSKLGGRDFLMEELEYPTLEKNLKELPARPQAGLKPKVNGVRNVVSSDRLLPERKRVATKKAGQQIKVAALNPRETGYVLDYSIINNDATNFTFKGNSTYYISGTYGFSGTTTLEGGTVIKGKDTGSSVVIIDSLVCLTDAYRPAIFTAKDDDSVGEIISDSTGIPSGDYWFAALDIFAGPSDLKYLRFKHAYYAIAFDGDSTTNTLSHSQFIQCVTPIYGYASALNLRNVLIYKATNAFEFSGFRVTAEHLTVNGCSNLAYDYSPSFSSMAMTNSLLVAMGSWGNVSGIVSNHVERSSSPSTVFQTAGAGAHYLATNSVYRNAGTTNINAALLADLTKKTTYPPIIYSSDTISVETTFSPQAQRDTDIPDLGYHYDPLDYVFGGTTANENLTFTNGTAVAWFWGVEEGFGLNIANEKVVTFDGRVDSYNYWAKYTTVQEDGNGMWTLTSGVGGLIGGSEDLIDAPEVRMKFTRCSMVADPGYSHIRESYGYMNLRATHCELLGGGLGSDSTSYYMTNTLFERVFVVHFIGFSGNEIAMRNCFFRGGRLEINPIGEPTLVTISNCVFDDTMINTLLWFWSGSIPALTNNYNFGYNAFITGTDYLYPTNATDIRTTNFNWQVGPLGRYYQRTNSILVNRGNQNATNVGLYHFTTQTDEGKEGNTQVDIGYHYVATSCGEIDTIWMDDAVPGGASLTTEGGDSWSWISSNPSPFSAVQSHISAIAGGVHQHYFTGATNTLTVNTNDVMIAYVFLDPTNTPTEIMLQWNDGGWGHRAYWGGNSITYGTDGTTSRRYMGALPVAGQWIRLEVPASLVGLEGITLSGMAFTLYGGRASWDYAGKSGGTSCYDTDNDGIPDYLEDKNGNGMIDAGESDFTFFITIDSPANGSTFN